MSSFAVTLSGFIPVLEFNFITQNLKINSPLCVSRSVVYDSLGPPQTVEHQASLSMGFSKQEYWSGLPVPSPGDLPDPGIEPSPPAWEGEFLTADPPGKPCVHRMWAILLLGLQRTRYGISLTLSCL